MISIEATHCKSAGSAFEGSSPSRPTLPLSISMDGGFFYTA
jgi:hypothetical protein